MRQLLLLTAVGLVGCTCEGTGPPPSVRAIGQPGPPGHRTSRAPDPPSAPADHPQVKRAQGAVKQLKVSLKEALLGALKQGPEQAVEVCATRAQAITQVVSQDGLVIGRASHQLRNPINKPKPWVEPLLRSYVARSAGPRYRTVELPKGVMGYVEPIYATRICATCHGSQVGGSVAQRIQQHYPKDRAIGFAAGDLRGVFWVEVPRAP